MGVVMKYKAVSLPEELIRAVKAYIKNNPSTGYSSVSNFIADAVRLRLQQLGALPPSLTLIHLNVKDNYALFWEQKPNERTGHSVQIFFSEENVKCGYCDSSRCYHVKAAVKTPEIIREFERRRKTGLPVPDISYLEE